MGKWYEIFRIPTEGKICEKTMVARVTVSTIVVLACLAAISVTAYAHFSANVTTSSNVISASGFRADVSVRVTDENGAIVPVSSDDGKAYTVTLKKDASYYVTVSPNADNTAKTGYVIVTVQGSDKRYHTQQIGLDGGVVTEAVSFRVQPNADMTVEFLSHWGTSSYYCDYKEFGDV